jgi:SAM-dependent methyltransferase
LTTDFVGADHEFHSIEFALGWTERFAPTPERMGLFELVYSQLKDAVPADGNIIELGIGPGYLANYLLERMPHISYCGIDFSAPMLEIARERLQQHGSRISYTQTDLVKEAWEQSTPNPTHAIVSTWALHDLGSPENINTVYEHSYLALGVNGILLNGDFIKPVGATQVFEGGRFPVTKHLELLRNAGFVTADCLSLFEEEIENPTPAQNYACIRARK